MAHGALAARPLLEGGHEARLPGRRAPGPLLKSTPLDRRKAAWLYAQFTVAKTTSLKKIHRRPDAHPRQRHQPRALTDRAPKLGGLVEFYRSPARVAWTPTGTNVPDYPKLAQLWWQNIGEAVAGEDTATRRWTTSRTRWTR